MQKNETMNPTALHLLRTWINDSPLMIRRGRRLARLAAVFNRRQDTATPYLI